MADRNRALARMLAAATALAVLAPSGASAQQERQEQPEQQDQQASERRDTLPPPVFCVEDDARPECAPVRDGLGRLVIYLPPLLAELFPSGDGLPASTQEPTPGPGPSQPGGPGVVPPLAVAPPATRPRAIAGAFVPDEVLVTIEGDAATAAEIAAAFGLEIRAQRVSALLGANVVRYGIPDGRPVSLVLAQLAADPRMRERVPNHIYQLQQAAGIISYAFGRIALDADAADGAGIDVAVIDSGLDETHPALAGVIADFYDALPDQPLELRGHGTSVAGIIAGVDAYRGVAPGARIHIARAFDLSGSTVDAILDAFEWAVGKDVRIINMSFVGPRNDLFALACRQARARGIVMVAAAGNNGPGAPFAFPAAYDEVIAVTATDENDGLMARANRGRYIHLAAPGVGIIAPAPGGSDVVTGTSFAAPVVTGVIANLLRAAPGRTPAEIADLLALTAVDLGEAGHDPEFGHGLVNAEGAFAQGR